MILPNWRSRQSVLPLKADLRIEWKETKRGRAVHSLQFTFEMLRPEDKGRQAELDL